MSIWLSLQQGVENVVINSQQTVKDTMEPFKQLPEAVSEQGAANPVRVVETAVGAVVGVISAPLDLANAAAAGMTNSISAALPDFPAAFLGSLYIGLPHAHAHPPSLVPPAPPVPLPSIGAITLGTCVQVLINGMPAARAGDLGLAPTCGGFAPFFEVKTGSSKVFIGGMRAARAIDFCLACMPSTDMSRTTAAAMKAAAVAAAMSQGMTLLSAVADGVDAANAASEGNAAMAEASALSAAMNAAQAAADIAAAVASKTMGTDPGIGSTPGLITIGSPNVLIGGIPLPNFPDIGQKLFEKFKNKLRKAMRRRRHDTDNGTEGCPTCARNK